MTLFGSDDKSPASAGVICSVVTKIHSSLYLTLVWILFFKKQKVKKTKKQKTHHSKLYISFGKTGREEHYATEIWVWPSTGERDLLVPQMYWHWLSRVLHSPL